MEKEKAKEQRRRKKIISKKEDSRAAAICICGFFCFCIVFFLSSCGAVEPEKRLYPLAIAFDYQEMEKMEDSDGSAEGEPSGKTAWSVWYAPANLPVVTGQEKDSGEEGSDADPSVLAYTGKNFDAIKGQYEKSEEYELDTSHVQAIVFSDALLENRGKTEELLQELLRDRKIGHHVYVFHAENPETLMKKNGTEIESVGTYLTGIYDNRVKRKKAVTLSEMCYAWENAGKLVWMPEVP